MCRGLWIYGVIIRQAYIATQAATLEVSQKKQRPSLKLDR
jgi:hypothetical protein